MIRRARRQTEYRPVFEDWVFYGALPCCTYGALIIGAFAFRANARAALFTIAASALALLLLGIHNAWDTVTHIVVTSERNRPSPNP